MKTAFITGATSGIGRATAQAFSKNGYRLVLCGRRAERLEELKAELGQQTPVHTLSFDVRDSGAVENAVASLPENFASIDVLVNNAGNAHGLSPIQEGDIADWDAMIDGNVKGLLYVFRAVIPGMTARQSGQIINIGSIAGKEVYPNGNVYCATKFAVDALTKSMQLDLNKYGIRVGAVHPGMVETEFSEVRFKGDTQRAAKVYQSFEPLQPQNIADVIMFMVNCPAHMNVADIVVTPTAQASATVVNRRNV